MRLRRPTDFLILEALAIHGRNVATNLETHTGKNRTNINTRLPILADYGLVQKIGPADRSGLYELTSLGKTALIYRDRYNDVDHFEALISGLTTDAPDSPVTASFARGEASESECDGSDHTQ